MYARVKTLLIVVGVLSVFVVSPLESTAHDGADGLPADLIFRVATGVLEPHHTLGRIDGQTGEFSIFYRNAEASMVLPLRWSPDGRHLVVLLRSRTGEEETPFADKFCLLDRVGTLQTCLAAPPYIDPDPRGVEWDRPVSWSADSRYVYFVTNYGWETTWLDRWPKACLVEADAVTGQTVRDVFCFPKKVRSLIWSPTLDYVVTDPVITRESVFISLEDGTTLDLYETFGTENTLGLVACPQISPRGSFFVLVATDRNVLDGDTMLIVDKRGRLVRRFHETEHGQEFSIGCGSAWTSDESAFYALGRWRDAYDTNVFRYNIAAGTLEIVYSWEVFSGNTFYGPFALSPDERCLAGTQGIVEEERIAVVVLCNGELSHPDIPYKISDNPLWVPPLAER